MNGVGVLIVSFRYTLPLAVHFHQQQDIGKVDTATPSLFQYADNSQSLLHVKDIHAGLEVFPAGNGVHIVVKLLNRAVLQFTVQVTEQNGLINEQLLGMGAVSLGHAFEKIHGSSLDGLILFLFSSHND